MQKTFCCFETSIERRERISACTRCSPNSLIYRSIEFGDCGFQCIEFGDLNRGTLLEFIQIAPQRSQVLHLRAFDGLIDPTEVRVDLPEAFSLTAIEIT